MEKNLKTHVTRVGGSSTVVGEPYVNIKVITDLKHLTKNKRKDSSDACKFKLTASVKRVLKKLKLK